MLGVQPPLPPDAGETAGAQIQLGAGLSMPALTGRLGRLGKEFAQAGVLATAEDLLRALADNHHFRRDTALGRMFHRRAISFREISPTDSLHIVFHRGGVSAHVDRISPLNVDPESPGHYSCPRVLAHNLSAAAGWIRTQLTKPRGFG